MKLDSWQEEVLKTSGNIAVRAGRQVGKSTVIARRASEFACTNRNKTILVIASVERQAYFLFEKILTYILDTYPSLIKKGKDRPTKHIIRLLNGSVIHCLPTGLSGAGIRGLTVDLLVADEAAFIPEEVWSAVTPMLAVTKGNIILLSTPFGREGFFYRAFSDSTFTTFHINSEDCSRVSKDFLASERKRMTKLQYAQEYLGEFVDELRQFFSLELIKSCMDLHSHDPLLPFGYDNYLGVDVARMGGDQTVLFSLRLVGDNLYQFDLSINSRTYTTDTVKEILALDKLNHYRRIYIDDGGLGVAVFDPLLLESQTKRKVVAINNSSRSLDSDSSRNKHLLKEDLYNNLLCLMEQGKIHLVNDPEILLSLKSVQYDYSDSQLKIFGSYTHIVEALIRAAWCVRDKNLKVYLY